MRVWDMAGRCLSLFYGYERKKDYASSDGSYILSYPSQGTLKLLDKNNNLIQLFGMTKKNKGDCFSPDGSRFLSASADGTLRLWSLDGTVERIFAAWEEQWYIAFFRNNQLEKIIGTELSWKMANLVKDGKTWTFGETGCFEWVPAQY